MKNKKIFFLVFLSLVVVFSSISHAVYGAEESVNFSLINNGTLVLSRDIPLPPSGVVSISDTDGNVQDVDGRSVINIIKNADETSSDFNISNLIYYSSFNAFYLKCINITGELCDGWLYKVNDESPESGMDQKILSGGEDVVLFFGDDAPPVDKEAEDIPVDEGAPEEEEEEPPAGGAGGSSGSRSRVVSIPDLVVPDLMPMSVSVSEPVIKEETQIEVKTQVAEKLPVVAKTKVEKKIAIQNTASVISTVNADNSVPVEEESKGGWFQRFLGWLFSF